MTLRIGSLFSGYEGLGLATSAVLDAEVAWVCDNDPAATKVLAHRYPNVPNLGDITAVDWDAVEPVDIVIGGSPCQDVSAAGRRLGMQPGTRSGLWTSMVQGIAALRPSLVIFENVRGILSAKANSDLEPCPWHLGGAGDGEPSLRALGRVLGDLADIGLDAEWTGLRASDIGAPHQRHREFLIAWPSDDAAYAAGLGRQRGGQHGDGGLDLRTAIAALASHADGAACGERRVATPGQAEGGGARPNAGGRGGAPDPVAAGSVARGVGRMLPTPRATDGTNGGPNQRGSSGDLMLPSAVAQLLPTPDATHGRKTTRTGPLIAVAVETIPFKQEGETHADTAEAGPREKLRDLRRSDETQAIWKTAGGPGGLPPAAAMLAVLRKQQGCGGEGHPSLARQETPEAGMRAVRDDGRPACPSRRSQSREQRSAEPADALLVLPPEAPLAGGPGSASCGCAAWGVYAAAVHRWEIVLGRPAPRPTEPGRDGKQRLSPRAVEFMMGLPAGWVTDVPGLSRSELLKLLGNGVVPQQGAAAIRALLAAAPCWGTGSAAAA